MKYEIQYVCKVEQIRQVEQKNPSLANLTSNDYLKLNMTMNALDAFEKHRIVNVGRTIQTNFST